MSNRLSLFLYIFMFSVIFQRLRDRHHQHRGNYSFFYCSVTELTDTQKHNIRPSKFPWMCKLLPLLGWIHFWGIFISFILLRDNVAIVVLLYMLHQPCTTRIEKNQVTIVGIINCENVLYITVPSCIFTRSVWNGGTSAPMSVIFFQPQPKLDQILNRSKHISGKGMERERGQQPNKTICCVGCCCIYRASRTAAHKHPHI